MITRRISFLGGETATIVLNVRAPSGGARFDLWSDDESVASVPSSATIAEGERTAELTITWVATGVTQVTARLVEIGGITIASEPTHSLAVECLPGGVVRIVGFTEVDVTRSDILVTVDQPPEIRADVTTPTIAVSVEADPTAVAADVSEPSATVDLCEE